VGSLPNGPLIEDGLGNLYGTARTGGIGAKGTVFAVKP
jgi:hypothetical protein